MNKLRIKALHKKVDKVTKKKITHICLLLASQMSSPARILLILP